jgi:hypothetical protein
MKSWEYEKTLDRSDGESIDLSVKLAYNVPDDLEKKLQFILKTGEYGAKMPNVFDAVSGTTLQSRYVTWKGTADSDVDKAFQAVDTKAAKNKNKKEVTKLYKTFESNQQDKITASFAKACEDWSKDVLKKATTLLTEIEAEGKKKKGSGKKGDDDDEADEETKKVAPNIAYDYYVGAAPLKFTVTNKFETDHLAEGENVDSRGLSQREAIEAALERYKRKGTPVSSWLNLTPSTVVNKVKSAQRKAASVFKSKQQIMILISVDSITAKIDKLSSDDVAKKRYKDMVEASAPGDNGSGYVLPSVESRQITVKVIGPWNPLTGEVDVYHYEKDEAWNGGHEFLPKYLQFIVDERGAPIRPAAKK